MKVIRKLSLLCLLCAAGNSAARAQPAAFSRYNVVWTTQSAHSGESMPCGGGDTGLNVWVENGDLLFYISRSGAFDENNTLLKQGRVRLRMSPNPFEKGGQFRQELMLSEGNIRLWGKNGALETSLTVWVDAVRPVVQVDISSNRPITAEATYESWRFADRVTKGKENNANSWKWAPQGEVNTRRDSIRFDGNKVLFYHRNNDTSVFDATVRQQGLDAVKEQLFNPLKDLTFGGVMDGSGMKPAGTTEGVYLHTAFRGWKLRSAAPRKRQSLTISLHSAQTATAALWKNGLDSLVKQSASAGRKAYTQTLAWWRAYWQRSFICINPASADTAATPWQAGRNYQLFRYMLGCNAFGSYPTKFNGGLFTYDPVFTDSTLKFTPDFRNWGGGTHTAQNQRLVYWPMLKSGDTDMMKSQFSFYLRLLKNAELRSNEYWSHPGACFTEQIENFGLPNPAEYGWKRPVWYDKGMEYNAWLEYEWDTVLEFCLMMLEEERYTGTDISGYIPFIESCLTFFTEHYQYLALRRGSKAFDANGHLVLYPGSAAETYKMTYNATSTVAALKTVISRLLELPARYLGEVKRAAWQQTLKRIPPLSFRQSESGQPMIAPARLWERINNTETPQLYPVFPWGIYGVGKPGLDTALNTWHYDTDALKFRSHVGWKQDNIFAARLGLTEEAARLTLLKLQNSGRRFPAFWGPGFDWTPDHNWGGSGMIGLQEMLMQTDSRKIILLPAWPDDWDAHFRLHAPYNTTVEGVVSGGKLTSLKVLPESRRRDVVVMNRP